MREPFSGTLPLISVAGTSSRVVVPDEVAFRVGIASRAKQLDAAKRDNDTRTGAILAALKTLGIPDTHVQSKHVAMAPHYPYSEKETSLTPLRYDVERTLEVRLATPARFDEVVTALLNSGATEIQDVLFSSSAAQELSEQVRLEAIQAAQRKATRLVEAVGARLGKVFLISEQPPRGDRHDGPTYGHAVGLSADSQAVPSTPTLVLGELILKSTIYVSFLIE